MSARTAAVFMAIFASIVAMMALGIWATERPMSSLCMKACWLNQLLVMLFGEQMAKRVLSGITFGLSLYGYVLALTIWRRAGR
jgi:quinol-cytochrome oxidoreductase complex cytochrome b subunit